MAELIEVVCAVIVYDGRILLTQRRPDKAYAYCWCTPGGKVDGNESHHDALKRELREEIGVEVKAIAENTMWSKEMNLPNGRFFVLFYAVELETGSQPKPLEGQGVGWFSSADLGTIELTPADEEAYDYLQKCVRASVRR